MNVHHKQRIKLKLEKQQGTYNDVYKNVPWFSLNTIMKAIGVTKVAGYFSLDVEGGEVEILNSIDFIYLSIE